MKRHGPHLRCGGGRQSETRQRREGGGESQGHFVSQNARVWSGRRLAYEGRVLGNVPDGVEIDEHNRGRGADGFVILHAFNELDHCAVGGAWRSWAGGEAASVESGGGRRRRERGTSWLGRRHGEARGRTRLRTLACTLYLRKALARHSLHPSFYTPHAPRAFHTCSTWRVFLRPSCYLTPPPRPPRSSACPPRRHLAHSAS